MIQIYLQDAVSLKSTIKQNQSLNFDRIKSVIAITHKNNAEKRIIKEMLIPLT